MKMNVQEGVLEEISIGSQEKRENEIVVYNDDVNTFDYVIETLIQTCDHNQIQAEQCTLLIHFKGKCTVKSGEIQDLEPRCSLLLEAGLSAEIV